MTENRILWKSLRAVAHFLSTLFFDLKIDGAQNVPLNGGALIVSNHQSYLDPVLLGVGLSRPLSYIAKSELFEITPALTWLFRELGGFPVHQERRAGGDITAVRQSIQRLRDGHILNIYPEGARTEDGEIARLEKGVVLIERRAGVPVIPAVIVGAFDAWSIHRRFPRPRPIRVQFGPPMILADLPPAEILTTIDRTLHRMFNDLRTTSGIPIPATRPVKP
jgi:1-acyl-sn-glycerol-3-phosphate acyltransferase